MSNENKTSAIERSSYADCSDGFSETDTEGNIYYKALDEMMIVACIGTADGCKTVADVRRKIDELIQWNIDVDRYFGNPKAKHER